MRMGMRIDVKILVIYKIHHLGIANGASIEVWATANTLPPPDFHNHSISSTARSCIILAKQAIDQVQFLQ